MTVATFSWWCSGLALVLVLIGLVGCGATDDATLLADVTLARDEAGRQPTTVFFPDETFYCIVELANPAEGTRIKARWIAVDAENTPANFFIDETEITTDEETIYFELQNDNLWPAGKYEVELYINDRQVRTLTFTVQ